MTAAPWTDASGRALRRAAIEARCDELVARLTLAGLRGRNRTRSGPYLAGLEQQVRLRVRWQLLGEGHADAEPVCPWLSGTPEADAFEAGAREGDSQWWQHDVADFAQRLESLRVLGMSAGLLHTEQAGPTAAGG